MRPAWKPWIGAALGLAAFWWLEWLMFLPFIECRFGAAAQPYVYGRVTGLGLAPLLGLALLLGLRASLMLLLARRPPARRTMCLVALADGLLGLLLLWLVHAGVGAARPFIAELGADLPLPTVRVFAWYPYALALPAASWLAGLFLCARDWPWSVLRRFWAGLVGLSVLYGLLFGLYVLSLFYPIMYCCKVL